MGQLGNWTTSRSGIALDVVGLGSGGVRAIDAGHESTCAVLATGVRCWGWNRGQLGNGTRTNQAQSTPVAVLGLRGGITAISAGAYHVCALTSAGRVKCWGDNDSGELGNGRTDDSWRPVDVVFASARRR